MSTILNALKQAEIESRKHASPPSFKVGQGVLLGSGRTNPYVLRPVLFIVIAIVLSGIVFACLYYFPVKNKVADPSVVSQIKEKNALSSLPPAVPPAAKPKPKPDSIIRKAEEKLRLIEKKNIVLPPPAQAVRQKPEIRQPSSPGPVPDQTAPPEIQPLENTGLEIQAISWNRTPSDRMTVIGNSILREGDRIQGFKIIQIEKDAVILNGNGIDYRLKFGYR